MSHNPTGKETRSRQAPERAAGGRLPTQASAIEVRYDLQGLCCKGCGAWWHIGRSEMSNPERVAMRRQAMEAKHRCSSKVVQVPAPVVRVWVPPSKHFIWKQLKRRVNEARAA